MTTAGRNGLLGGLLLILNAPGLAGAAGYTFQTVDYPSAVQVDQVSGLNDAGTLVGYYGDAQGNNHSYVATPDGKGGYGFSTFDAPDADSTFINGLNASGQFAGSVNVNSVFYGFQGSVGSSAVTAVEVPGSTYTFAYGINDSGAVVGRYSVITMTSGQVSGFLTTDGGKTFTSLDEPDADHDTEAFGINAAGTVVGIYRTPDTAFHGFVATPGSGGTFTYSAVNVPGSDSTYLHGINSLGQLVGSYNMGTPESIGFVATPNGSSYDFQTLNDPLGVHGTEILGINDSGVVVGTYFDANNVGHGFVAIPNAVPEPSSLALAALGGLGVWGRRVARRRAGAGR